MLMNAINFFRFNLKKEISITQEELLGMKTNLRHLKQEILYLQILNYYNNHSSLSYESEINYLKTIGQIALFPYKQLSRLNHVEVGYDKCNNLPYVIHRQYKLYYPSSWSLNAVKENYIGLVEEQAILGGKFMEKSPHQYLTDTFQLKNNDIVLDIGAAEGLFALDIVPFVKKVYIYECETQWILPLKETFKPFAEKVKIINKKVSNVDNQYEVRLDTSIEHEDIESIFMKLDIEGSEVMVIEENVKLLKKKYDIRVSCCTYHKHGDAESLKGFFEKIDFTTEFSEGYMIYVHDENIKPPYFRKGLIRAKNNTTPLT